MTHDPKVWLRQDPGFGAATYYDCDEESEALLWTDPDEAIEAALDAWLSPGLDVLEALRDAYQGGFLVVFAYQRKSLPSNVLDVDMLLEYVCERLDEDYGNPEEWPEEAPELREAAEAFASAVQRSYRVWQCDQVATAIVDIEAWVRAERPEWLESE